MPLRRSLLSSLALVLLLVACAPSTATSTPISPLPSPSPLSWQACSAPFQCSTLIVPRDYAHPSSGSVSIALIRLPATDPTRRLGSLLVNPGGPGASGIDFLRNASFLFSPTLRARFDLVSFDPRGIGASTSVHCLDAATLDTFNALDPVLDDEAEKQAVISADQGFAAGCQNKSASLLPYLSTQSTARDLDLMRVALGDMKLTYLGFSYGTYLGLTYAQLFPTHIRALVLDGVFDPSLDANTLLHDQLEGFEANLQAFFASCRARAHAASDPCAYAQKGDPSSQLDTLLTSLDTPPGLKVGNRFLTRALAYIGVLTPLYDPSSWPQLDSALTAAAAGNGAPLLALSDLYLSRNPDGTYNNEEEASIAINCLDRPVPTALSAYDALSASYDEASPFFGPAFQYSNLSCAYWPTPPVSSPAIVSSSLIPPLLLVGATHDPATPYAWAQSVASHLPASVLLTRNGYGHTSYGFSSCISSAVDTYLTTLVLPARDTTCS